MHLDPGPNEIGRVRWINVASGDCHPPAPGNERKRTHTGTGDPHEVNGSGIFRGKQFH